jgi:hypothetical protein
LSIGFTLKGQRFAGAAERQLLGAMAGSYRGHMTLPQIESPLKSTYYSYGALLGCEYVEATGQRMGRGRRVTAKAGGVTQLLTTCTYDHHAVMVRYVLLIPPGAGNGILRGGLDGGREWRGRLENTFPFPTRSQIRTQLLENMESIERKIERRTLEG